MATRADVGTPKVLAMKQHLQEIVPNCDIEAINCLFKKEDAERLLAGAPAMVVDCIDNMDTKVDLILHCVEHNLPVVASMGAGARVDPSRICVGDVFHSESDPMAKDVRLRLKKAGVKKSIPVVYSTEKVEAGYLKPLEENQVPDAHELAAFDNFRVRILPVCGTIPAMFGNALASYALCEVMGKKIETKTNIVHKNSTYSKILGALQEREKKCFGVSADAEPLFDTHQAQFLVDTVWGGKSGVSGMQRGINLVRWDKEKPLSAGNVILLTKTEADQHEQGLLEIEEAVRSRILHTLAGAAQNLPEKQKSKREQKKARNREIEANKADKAKRAEEWASGLRTKDNNPEHLLS